MFGRTSTTTRAARELGESLSIDDDDTGDCQLVAKQVPDREPVAFPGTSELSTQLPRSAFGMPFV
jgi:hypothetical protein